MEDFDTDHLDHYLAMYLFEQEVMEEVKRVAERPEEYAQVLAIMWTDTKRKLAVQCQEAAFDMIEGMFRLQRLGFDRVEEYGAVRKRDRRTARARHGLEKSPERTAESQRIAEGAPPAPPAYYDDMSDVGFTRAVQRLVGEGGLTVRDAAEAVGCSLPTIQRWIHGGALPHPNMRPHALRALRDMMAK